MDALQAGAAPLALLLLLDLFFHILAHQRFTVGDRDTVIIRVDFGESQKAVAVAAVIDKGGLQRGFNPRNLREENIPL